MTEFETIKEQFKEVIRYSQHIEDPKVDELFEIWYEKKKKFIDAMGGQLVYELPEKLSFELDQKEKANRINEFIEAVYYTWHNEELSDFLHANREGFFSNQVVQSHTTSKGVTVPTGMKLVKSFKFFESDQISLEQLQNKASMIIQEDKIEGKLCFSVHPLDFLSSSENTYNWRSCHALDGEYRAGNLSYMVDSSTIMVYLKSDKGDVRLPNFPADVSWNSKKWRMLLFLDDNWQAMFAGRQYPFDSVGALSLIQKNIVQILGIQDCRWNVRWSNWHNDEVHSHTWDHHEENEEIEVFFRDTYLPIGRRLYTKRQLITDVEGSKHFNDLINSTVYIPYYCYNMYYNGELHFTIGGMTPCLCCGNGDMAVTDSMLCVDCELDHGCSEDEMFITCDCCGRRMLDSDAHWVAGAEEYVCDGCLATECSECESCGDLVYNRDIVFDKYHHEYRCTDCFDYEAERALQLREYQNSVL